MPDILIRGMEMPETCGQCPIFNYDYNICNFLSTHHHEYETSRIDGCPLHELPEHGDLVSKDDVMSAILGEPPEAHYQSWYAGIVNEIPAIIQSNKEESE